MSETTPNAKGPAKAQMSPEMMASLGLTPTPEATSPQEPTLIPATEVKPEDIGTLSIEYRDGQPVIVVRGGTVIPARLAVYVQDSGGYEFYFDIATPSGAVSGNVRRADDLA